MTDDPNRWTDPDNPQEAEIRYLVENTDLSPNQAKELVAKHGTDRETLLNLAREMQAEG
jgi:plasmid maintenance system antidote protein VapI